MHSVRNLFYLLFLALVPVTSFAGLLVEPFAGFNIVREVSVDGGDDYKSGGGFGYGGRLGWQKGGFQLGGDYLYSSIDMTDSDFKKNIVTKEYGVFVGYEFPVLLRAYGEYILSADGDTKINNQKQNLSSGNGWKLGLGFTLLPFLDINVDYREISFKDQDLNAFMLGLSIPLDLF